MENIKYIGFYALLVIVIVLGVLQYPWWIIVPSALVLTLAYIAVKGSTWKQIMGKGEMNGSVVFIAAFVSQLVLAGILYGIGRLVAMMIG